MLCWVRGKSYQLITDMKDPSQPLPPKVTLVLKLGSQQHGFALIMNVEPWRIQALSFFFFYRNLHGRKGHDNLGSSNICKCALSAWIHQIEQWMWLAFGLDSQEALPTVPFSQMPYLQWENKGYNLYRQDGCPRLSWSECLMEKCD